MHPWCASCSLYEHENIYLIRHRTRAQLFVCLRRLVIYGADAHYLNRRRYHWPNRIDRVGRFDANDQRVLAQPDQRCRGDYGDVDQQRHRHAHLDVRYERVELGLDRASGFLQQDVFGSRYVHLPLLDSPRDGRHRHGPVEEEPVTNKELFQFCCWLPELQRRP